MKQGVKTQNRITKRKEALKESEEWFRSIVQNSHDGIMILDNAYRFTYVNDELCRMAGYSRKEVIGQDFRKFLDEESQQLVANRYLRRQRGEEIPPRYEFNIVKKDGQKRRVEVSSSIIKDPAGQVKTVAQVLDITERREAEELYRTLASSSPVGVYIVQDGKFQFVNPQFQKYTGFSEDELLGTEPLKFVHPEDRKRVRESAVAMLKGNHLPPYELRYIVKKGDTLWAKETVTSIRYKGKQATLGNFTDITERKRTEETLRQSREKLRQMFESVTDGILVIDLNGVITEVNQRTVEMHGYKSKGELFGKSAFKLVAPRDHERIATNMRQAIKEGQIGSIEYTMLRANGTEFPAELSTSVLRDASGKPAAHITIVRDITERKQTEEIARGKLEFERIISAISSRFVSPSDMDDAINKSLADIGKFSGASRAYLFLFQEDGTTADNTNEWCAEGVSSQIANSQNMSGEDLQWIPQIRQGELVEIEDISQMPPEQSAAKAMLESQEDKSLLLSPAYDSSGKIPAFWVLTRLWVPESGAMLLVPYSAYPRRLLATPSGASGQRRRLGRGWRNYELPTRS